MNDHIDEIYKTYSMKEKEKLNELSHFIKEEAKNLNIELSTSLKWGQLTFSSKTGTPIRIDRFSEDQVALFVHCQTTLVEEWREMFSDVLCFSKNRAILFETALDLPKEELKICIQMALTYKKK